MKEWLEQGAGVIFIGAAGGIGLAVRMLLFGYYGRLYKACKRFEKSHHKAVVYIKADLKRRGENGQEIKNAMTYTECRLAECRVLGFRIGWLENWLLYSALFVLVCGVMAAFAGTLSGCEERTVLSLLLVNGVTVLGLLATDMVLGLRERYKRIRLMIRDYIDNSWSVRAEWMEDNLLSEELSERSVKKKEERNIIRKKKSVSKDKPIKMKAGKKGKAQEEKRRLTEELLRERRQLEARSFAEQRKRELDMQAEQVQEEAAVAVVQCEETETVAAVTQCEETEIVAAVTQCEESGGAETVRGTVQTACSKSEAESKGEELSYEQLLSEVLAEYLA